MRTSIYGQRRPRSNPADVCKSPRKACNVTRWIFRRLFRLGTGLGFVDQGEFEAVKTLSGWEAARCDEHPFRAKIKVST